MGVQIDVASRGKVYLPDTYNEPARHAEDDSTIYQFLKVEEFFGGFEEKSEKARMLSDGMLSAFSPTEGPIKGYRLATGDLLTLEITLSDSSLLLIEVLRYDTFRIRWGPAKRSATDYSRHLSRSIVMNNLQDLRSQLAEDEGYRLTATLTDVPTEAGEPGRRVDWSVKRDGMEWMKIVVSLHNFSIQAWRWVSETVMPLNGKRARQQWSMVWSTTSASDADNSPLLCRRDAEGNYATCLSTIKRGKMMGFGEQGGLTLLKDKQQLNLYNYDNLAYSSVYGEQAINPSEPLYHSDPFGVELNGVDGYQSCIGVFVDDVSQLFFDLGCRSDNVMRIGSRFADLEVHITCATDLEHACLAHSSCVGRGKLFPRYILGYHQGCYGYDSREKVEACAEKHRRYKIPLDAIHIDVDLQKRYRTFTVDDAPNGKFPDPKAMFDGLKQMGIKCSTNITPVISSEDDEGKSYWESNSQARLLYRTLDEGLQKGYFIKEQRWNCLENPPTYTHWEGGKKVEVTGGRVENLNQTETEYRGGVSYGPDLGTTGVYPDLGRKEVRDWWGRQYANLFDVGLSMVWQDMTTPCIKVGAGDMKTFPFRLLLSDDSESVRQKKGILTPALKIQNLYSYNLHKATYKGMQRLSARKGLRNFIIGRGSFTGQHRFSATWTGDNCSSWRFLRINIQQVISMGIGGTVITGADVGGFESHPFDSNWCDPTLLIRWTLANTLLPWMRNHYMGKEGKKIFQEPYAYYENAWRVPQQEALYRSVLPICRYYISLRYTLLQLLYDTYVDSVHTGSPIARSLLHTDPWDLSLLDINSHFLAQEYVVGKDVVVAPIVYSEQELKQNPSGCWKVYLPHGSSFYDFNLHLQSRAQDVALQPRSPSWLALKEARLGGVAFEYHSSVERYVEGDVCHLPYLLPIFIRQGAILPTIQSEDYVGQLRPNPVTIHFYPLKRTDMTHCYDMYLDDGVSLASAPAHLPQFKLDRLAGAASDYRHLSFTQSCAVEQGSQTRTLQLTLIHCKYDLARVRSDIGPVLTLQVWHDEADNGAGELPPSVFAVTSSQGDQVQRETLDCRYDATLHATTIQVPVDDIYYRTIKLVYVA